MGSTGIKDNSNWKHVWAGILIVIITGVVLQLFMTAWYSCPIALVLGIGSGLAKEYIWDSYMGKGTFNLDDIWATTWGSFVGLVILIFIVNFIM